MKRFEIVFLGLALALLSQSSCRNEHESERGFLSVSTNILNVEAEGTVESIIVSTNLDWDIISTIPDWISVVMIDKAPDYILELSVSRNEGDKDRSATIVLNGGSFEEIIYIVQRAVMRLNIISDISIDCSSKDSTITVLLDTNCPYAINTTDDWISINGSSNSSSSSFLSTYRDSSVKVYISKNDSSKERGGRIVFLNDKYALSDTLTVFQKGSVSDYYADGDWECIQKSSFSPAPTLFIMGDGFIREDLAKNGTYRNALIEAEEFFFNIEPYLTYRDFFNVYFVYAESPQRGVGDKNHHKIINNRFGSKYGTGTEIDANIDLCLQYARLVEDIPDSCPLTVLMVLNDEKYAGTTYMYLNGDSVALCPMTKGEAPNNFEGAVHHECGGHGFGFLADEYIYHDKTIPEDERESIKKWQEYGFQANIVFSSEMNTCPWSCFIGHEKYPGAGLFEGGALYRYGVWRSEDNSCMNNNVPYYNVQSRRIIVQRIMDICGLEFVLEDFIELDSGSEAALIYSANTRSSVLMPHLASPILIDIEYH